MNSDGTSVDEGIISSSIDRNNLVRQTVVLFLAALVDQEGRVGAV